MGVETYTGPDGGKQKLSRAARAKRNADNIAMAKTKDRKDKKAENQRIGQRSDSDLHHASGTVKRTSIAHNRASHTRGEVKT